MGSSQDERGGEVIIRETHSEEETLEVGRWLASRLSGGSVVHLSGDLGLGKTRFAKGLAAGLGLDPDDVRSPTFTIVQIHQPARPGALSFVHVDLYRIADPSELGELGLDELPGSGAIAAVEWPERLAGLARPGFVTVRFDDLGPTDRRLTVTLPSSATPPVTIL